MDPNDQIDDGSIADGVYRNDQIGWRMEIPDGWEILSRENNDQIVSKGKSAMGDTLQAEIDTSELRYLVSFRKDELHIFQSYYQPFKEEYPGEWSESEQEVFEAMLQVYVDNGIAVEDTSFEKEQTSGQTFFKYTVRLSVKDGDFVFHQIMYSQLINGYDFGASITYHDRELGQVMIDAWRSSRFR